MIQLADLEKLTPKDIEALESTIQPILSKRVELKKRIYRNGNSQTIMAGVNPIIAMERYIVETASGYLGGKAPKYEVQEIVNPEKRSLIKRILDKVMGEKNLKDEMEIIMQYITNYNDDGDEFYRLVRDVMEVGACYEIIYESEDNEKVYSRLDPTQTVAIYDYSTPVNLIGVARLYKTNDISGNTSFVMEITDRDSKRTYRRPAVGAYELVKEESKLWGDVPAICFEDINGISIFEPIIDLVKSYEQVYNNCKNTHQYNDEAKLKVTGYTPNEPLTIPDENGNLIANPARQTEDAVLLNSKVFYTPDKDGDIEWIEKNINDGAVTNFEKTTIDLISLVGGVPNTTDTGFSNADNSSALEKKFFTLEQIVTSIAIGLRKELLRRWELIFNRINMEKNTKYDFRQIEVKLYRNMPTDRLSETDMALKLRGLVSDETVIGQLPYEFNPQAEIEQLKKEQEEEPIDILKDKEVIKDEDKSMETDRQEVVANTNKEQENK